MLSIYNYKDPIDFISSYLNLEKEKNEEFSLRKFAMSIGLTSTAPLIDVLQRKKKLKDKLAFKIADKLKIDGSEKMYFEALVAKSQSESIEKARLYDLMLNELTPTNKESFKSLKTSKLDIFSHWVYMAILSLSELPQVDFSVKGIRERLREKLDESLIEKALTDLFDHGLLTKLDCGKVENTYSRVTTEADVFHDNVQNYYELVCDLAKKAIPVPLDYREFNTFSFPIAKKDIPLAKEIIRQCRNKLSRLSESPEVSEVYQANLILFPLTESEEKYIEMPEALAKSTLESKGIYI